MEPGEDLESKKGDLTQLKYEQMRSINNFKAFADRKMHNVINTLCIFKKYH